MSDGSYWDEDTLAEESKNQAFEQTKSIVHDELWQYAVLGHMIQNAAFFMRCRSVGLDPEFFVKTKVRHLCRWMYEFFDIHAKDTNNQVPTFFEIEANYINRIKLAEEKAEYRHVWNAAVMQAKNINIQSVKNNMTNFMRSRSYLQAIRNANQKFNNPDKHPFEQAVLSHQEEMKKIQEISFDDDGTFKFNNIQKLVRSMTESRKQGVPTGARALDKLLAGEDEIIDTDGKKIPAPGLKYGDTTMLMGPLNSGKTTAMITFIAHAIEAGKSVCYFTHEMQGTDIALRLIYALMKKPKHVSEIRLNSENPITIAREEESLAGVEGLVNRYLRYRPYNKAGGMYVEDVISNIKMLNEEMMAKTGKGFDLVVNDYPAKLSSKLYATKRTERRLEEEYIYDQFVQLALELNCHCLLGVQTNREGFKKSSKGSGMVTVDDVSESFGIMRIATNVITVNRSDEDKAQELVHMYIAKSRSSKTEMVFSSHTDMATGLMWSDVPLNYDKLFEETNPKTSVKTPVSKRMVLQATAKPSHALEAAGGVPAELIRSTLNFSKDIDASIAKSNKKDQEKLEMIENSMPKKEGDS